MEKLTFQQIIAAYYKKGRNLPWRKTRDPYLIAVSEIMLQQTQVDRVLPKYLAFIERFPTLESLASAPVSDVLMLWKGLGYNRRALFLQRLAQEIIQKHSGRFPKERKELQQLPGIGTYTAGAICAFAFRKSELFIETNIRRVFIHHFFHDKHGISDAQIMQLLEKYIDRKKPHKWYWALMDYGSELAKTVENPNRKSKHYVRQSKFQGSQRQMRGWILHFLLVQQKGQTALEIAQQLGLEVVIIKPLLTQLTQEGFLKKSGLKFQIQ